MVALKTLGIFKLYKQKKLCHRFHKKFEGANESCVLCTIVFVLWYHKLHSLHLSFMVDSFIMVYFLFITNYILPYPDFHKIKNNIIRNK